jgi:hypothetical protein
MGGSGVSEVLSAFGANLAGIIEARTGGSLQCATDVSPASFRNARARTAHWTDLHAGIAAVPPGLLPKPNWYRELSGSVVACKPKLPAPSSAFIVRKPEMQFVVFFAVPSQADSV